MAERAKRKRLRSPAYPVIALEEAIERVKTLWDKEKNNPMHKEVAAEHLGYETYGGYSGRILAALKQFGLISEDKGAIILTQEAVHLSVYEPTDDKYRDIIRQLAVKPISYERLFNEYSAVLPSDASLKIKLLNEYSFHPEKVDQFIKNFRRTLKFAGLDRSNSFEKEEETMTGEREVITPRSTLHTQHLAQSLPEHAAPQGGRSFPIPLSGNSTATFVFTGSICKEDLETMKQWIDLFGKNLVE